MRYNLRIWLKKASVILAALNFGSSAATTVLGHEIDTVVMSYRWCVGEGLLWMECKALYSSGLRVYLLDNYNWIDFIVLSMYLSSYALRFLVDRRIKFADLHYNGTSRARHALVHRNFSQFYAIKNDIFADCRYPTYSYFMKACQS